MTAAICLDVADLLVVDQDVGVVKLSQHLVRVGHEVGGDVALIELHSLDDVYVSLHALSLLDSDDALLLDLTEGLGDQLADLLISIGGEGGYVLDLLQIGAYLDALLLQILDDDLDCLIDTSLDLQRGSACGNVLESNADDTLCEDSCGSGSVTGVVVGLRGHLFDQLGTHVLIRILQLDLLSYGDTILGDVGSAKLAVQDHVASLR